MATESPKTRVRGAGGPAAGRRQDAPHPAPPVAPAAAATVWWARPRVVVGVVAVGLLVRLLISAVSYGTNDAATFLRFGLQVDAHGLLGAYQKDVYLNHPPIPTAWTWAAFKLTDGESAFPFVFKLPVIAVEAVAAWVLWRRWLEAGSARRAALAAGGYALSLCAILVSGYHCNTDNVYATLCLLSVWLLEARNRPLAGGSRLAAAINVKLIPVLLIPGLLLSLRTRRDAIRFLGGLSVGVLPFVPVLIAVGPSFYRNALAYGSSIDHWGVHFFLLPSDALPPVENYGASMAYYAYAKYPLLAVLVAWAAVARRLGRWDRYEVAAVTLAVFLVFAPGFGVQYTVILVPLMFAARPGLAAAYSLAAGAFLAAVYGTTLIDSYPLYSRFWGFYRPPAQYTGIVAWGLLACFAAAVLARPAPALPARRTPTDDD